MTIQSRSVKYSCLRDLSSSKALDEGYFEDLIRKYLLDNTHGAILSRYRRKALLLRETKNWKKN